MPLVVRADPSEKLAPEQEAMLARYRKTVLQKDDHKKKAEALRGAMQ